MLDSLRKKQDPGIVYSMPIRGTGIWLVWGHMKDSSYVLKAKPQELTPARAMISKALYIVQEHGIEDPEKHADMMLGLPNNYDPFPKKNLKFTKELGQELGII